jgi:hypothetical protein
MFTQENHDTCGQNHNEDGYLTAIESTEAACQGRSNPHSGRPHKKRNVYHRVNVNRVSYCDSNP